MATTTTNLALTKSAGSENYSIDIVNANLDKIDAGCVNVSGSQTIAGVKTFANDVNINTASNSFIVTRDTRLVSGTIPSSELQHAIIYRASSGTANHGYITWTTQTDGSGEMYLAVRDYTGWNNRSMITLNASSTPHITATYRTYNSTNTGDVVTIGSLQASTDVVHTSGNETVAGIKTFTNVINRQLSASGQSCMNVIGGQSNNFIYRIYDSNGKDRGYINHQCIISGDLATRFYLVLQSPNYDTTLQTGATASIEMTLNASTGRFIVKLNSAKGDGTTTSTTLGDITPS